MDTVKTAVMRLSIPEQKTFKGQCFPLVITPVQEYNSRDLEFWCSWIKDNNNWLEDELLQYGAILFRDFPITSAEDFDVFVKMFGYKSFPYVGGAAPRTVVTGNVFTANEAPSSAKIPYHHEMAQVPNFPKVLFFQCDIAPSSGGQTTLVPSNVIYEQMLEREPEFVQRLEKDGVRYIRVLPESDDPTSAIGRGWKSTYLTDNKEDAIRKAKEQGTTVEWLDNGCLKTITEVLPATRVDTRTGKKVWFNSIIAAYLGWQDSRNERTKSVVFANGDPMDARVMHVLEEVFEANAVDFNWKKVICYHFEIEIILNKQVS